MPRKKAKRSKVTKNPKAKKRVKQVISSLSEAMERDFKHLPKQLPIQFRKEIAILKQRQSKLAIAIKKLEKQKKAAKADLDTITIKLKNKSTPAVKKQLKALTTECSQINQMISSLTLQWKQTNKQLDTLSFKQAKFAALSKEISRLDKQWDKKQTKSETPLKQKRKKRSNKTQLISSSDNTQSNSDQADINVSNPETVDTDLAIEESQEV